MTFPLLGKSYFFACAAMPRNRAKRDAKNSRSDERGCSSVPPPPNRRRMGGGSNPASPPTGYAAQSREARCKKQPERRARMFLCSPAAEQAANGWRQQPGPTTNRLCRAIARSAVQKQPERRALRPQARFGAQPPQAALGAEIGCSSVHPPPNRRRMGGGDNLALALGRGTNPAPLPAAYRRTR